MGVIARAVAAVLCTCIAEAARAQDGPWSAFEIAYRTAADARIGEADPGAVKRGFARALEEFLKVPEATAGREEWLPAAGYCASQAGDGALAADLYRSALDAGTGGSFVVRARLDTLLELGRVADALDEARRLEAMDRTAVDGFLTVARGRSDVALLREAGRRLRNGDDEAGSWVLERTAEVTGSALDIANHALALRFLGRLDAALSEYRRALELRPEDDVLWNDYGLALKAAGRTDAALEAFRRSLEFESAPGMGPGTTNLAALAATGLSNALPDPVRSLRDLLSRRPDAELARRLYIDAILRRPRAARGDSGGISR